MARRIETKFKRELMPTIMGAGITEQWYFTHLKSIFGYRVKVRPRFFGNETAEGMAKKIAEVIADGGIAICVYDADVSIWNEVERGKLERLRTKYAENKQVILCDSMPAVEYWFLLHYENTNRHFGTSEAVIQKLKQFLPDYDKSEKFLRNRKWVADMCSDGKLDQAIVRAKQFGYESESYSRMIRFSMSLTNSILRPNSLFF